jgi:hypothetical protein
MDTPTIVTNNRPLHGFHLLQLRSALKLEILGLKMSRGRSVYGYIKQHLGFKGNKQSVLAQLEAHIESEMPGVIQRGGR